MKNGRTPENSWDRQCCKSRAVSGVTFHWDGHRAVVGFRLVLFEKSVAVSLANFCVKVEKNLSGRFMACKRRICRVGTAGGCTGLMMRDWVPIEMRDWGGAGYWPCPRLAPRRLTGTPAAFGVWQIPVWNAMVFESICLSRISVPQYRWLTHTGREVAPSGLKLNSRISAGDLLPSRF